MVEKISSSEQRKIQKDIIVFDMDGTLYQLDGNDYGYSSSSLEKAVLQNVLSFLMTKENLDETSATALLNEIRSKSNGFSTYFSNKYGITRSEYFDQVWNIDPKNIVTNYEIPVQVVKQLSRHKQLILLTSAPKVWQSRVLSFLDIDNHFSEIFTAEQFGQKEEIFTLLSQRENPANILSVGDQLETDINPAQKHGIDGIHISSPNDLLKLLELI